MSKFYTQWRRPKAKERQWRIHPVWRGIGCLMIVLIPLLSYGLAHLAVEANREQGWVAIPIDLLGPTAYPYLYAKLALAVLIAVVIFALYTIFYIVVYQVMGPPRYGPLDAPPVRRRPRRRSRRRY